MIECHTMYGAMVATPLPLPGHFFHRTMHAAILHPADAD